MQHQLRDLARVGLEVLARPVDRRVHDPALWPGRPLRLARVTPSPGDRAATPAPHVGTAVDQVLLYCYHYNPSTGQYGFVLMRAVRVGGALTLLALVGFVIVSIRRDHRKAGQ